MKELKEYYKKWKTRLQIILVPIWLLLSLAFFELNELIAKYIGVLATNQIQIITQDNALIFNLILEILLDMIAPAAIVFGVYSFALKYVNEKGWKKKYPEYDISGAWKDTTYYTQYLDKSGLSSINTKHSELSPVIIEQTCDKIKIKESVGEGFKWYSLLCDWNGSNLDILYAVEYYASLQDKGYPEKRYGFESMCIDTKKQQPKERPSKMVGKFWHCCSADGKPVYMGDVVYERDIAE